MLVLFDIPSSSQFQVSSVAFSSIYSKKTNVKTLAKRISIQNVMQALEEQRAK